MTDLRDLPIVLTVPEVARQLRVGRNTAYQLVNAGAIGSVRIGSRMLVPRESLSRYLEIACSTEPRPVRHREGNGVATS